MYTLPSPDYLHLSYRPDLRLLVARWMRQTTAAEMQQGYSLVLEHATEQQCQRWLIDARRRDHPNQGGAQWMIDTFLPQLQQRIKGSIFIAYLFSPAHLQELEADTSVVPLSYFQGRPYELQRFTEELAAVNWLDARCPPYPLAAP